MDQSPLAPANHVGLPGERVKSVLRRDQSGGSLPFGLPDPNINPSPSVELIHQTLKVLCNWKPGYPVAGLTQAENAYLALCGIALSQVELSVTGNVQQADQSLTTCLESLDMACDTLKYDQWRTAVTDLWRLANERHNQGRAGHSIQRLVTATPIEEPPRDCLGALCALGLLQSLLPDGIPDKKSHPLNPLFMLKHRNPDVPFDAISKAFQTRFDVNAFNKWNGRVNAIMECMGPLPSIPSLAYGMKEVSFVGLGGQSTNEDSDCSEPRFLRFRLDEKTKEAAARVLGCQRGYSSSAIVDLNVPEGGIWIHSVAELHHKVIGDVFVQLGELHMLQPGRIWVADVQSVYHSTGSITSYDYYHQVIVPMGSTEASQVSIDNTLVGWDLDFAYVLDENVPLWTNTPIEYVSIYVRK